MEAIVDGSTNKKPSSAEDPTPPTSSDDTFRPDNKPTTGTGGVRSANIDYLTHPLDRSIAFVFVLTVFFTILALVTGAPIVLLLLALVPPSVIIKKLLSCRWLPCPSGHLTPVGPIDGYWLRSAHVCQCLLFVDKGLSVEQLRDIVASRVLGRPEMARFRSRIIRKGVSRTPFWLLKPTTDQQLADMAERHVVEDEPLVSKSALRKRLKKLINQQLPKDKPLWQIRWSMASYCDQVVLIVRVHQAVSDGVGLVSVLSHCLSDSAPMPVGPTGPIRPRFGGQTLPVNIFRAVIVGPLTVFLWLIWSITRRQNNYLKKGKNKLNRSIYMTSYDLAKVVRIKQITRSTLNDVLVSAVAGGVRTYLETRSNIFNPPDLNISVPIDIRPAVQFQDPAPGVNFVLVTSPLPTNTEGAIPRLWEVRHLMDELKTSADTAVMYGCHTLLTRLLPLSMVRFLIDSINRNSSICISNLQGSVDQPLTIGSYRLNQVHYFMSPPPSTAITINMVSYDGRLFFSISTQSRLIPSARILARLFKAQLNRLSSLLSRRRVPGEGRRRKSRIPIVDMPTFLNSPSSAGNELTARLHEVQFELQQLSEALEAGQSGVAKKFEDLKDEFTGLMLEMRRRKSIAEHGPGIVINIEDDDDDIDGELRPPPTRRFSVVSMASRRASFVGGVGLPSTSRVTPPILSRRAITTSPEPPSSPEVAFRTETEC